MKKKPKAREFSENKSMEIFQRTPPEKHSEVDLPKV